MLILPCVAVLVLLPLVSLFPVTLYCCTLLVSAVTVIRLTAAKSNPKLHYFTMPRDQQISTYVTSETKNEIDRRADEEDLSVSAYTARLIERGLVRESEDDITSETRAKENLERLISEGTDDLSRVARQIQDAESQWARYSMVNFLILKNTTDLSEQEVNQLFETAAERFSDHTGDIEAEAE